MALTSSNMMPLGTKAPGFILRNVITDSVVSLEDIRGEQGTVIMFICAHCPYVKHLESNLSRFAAYYQSKGVGFIAISSNDIQAYPDDAPDKLKIQAERNGFDFPYLYDESQEVARDYMAACTPDFYLFDGNLMCVYRGRYDASRPGGDVEITGQDLAAAIDGLLDGKSISEEQYPSMGCNIKWTA